MTNITTKVYVGIDVSKATLDIYISLNKRYIQVKNTETGIAELVQTLRKLKVKASEILIGMESTGGLHKKVVVSLNKVQCKVSVINPEYIWAYRRSLGKRAKTDKIDSKLIADYLEGMKPKVSRIYSDLENELKELSSGRMQYTGMLGKEKKRLKQCISEYVKEGINRTKKYIEEEIKRITKRMREIIESDEKLSNNYKLIYSIPGIGEVVALTIIAEIPEIGEIEDKEIASLVGVAPMVRESGTYKGKSRIHGGRNKVRSILYMAAFNALIVNKSIGAFAARLKAANKPYMVIMVATMRKLIVYANVLTRNNSLWSY